MEEILKYTFSQYVKRRFAELRKEGVNGEIAYTRAVGEYVDAALKQVKKEANAKR